MVHRRHIVANQAEADKSGIQWKQSEKNESSSFYAKFIHKLFPLANILPLLALFTTWLEYLDYYLVPMEYFFHSQMAGFGLLVLGDIVLHISHAQLGSYWTPTLQIRDEHKLIDTGIYAWVRHPMYLAVLLYGLALLLIAHNYIISISYNFFSLYFAIIRVPKEEKMMIQEFGQQYETYMKYTGGLFPKLFGKSYEKKKGN